MSTLRKNLIRLAATLPKGPDRKQVLHLLSTSKAASGRIPTRLMMEYGKDRGRWLVDFEIRIFPRERDRTKQEAAFYEAVGIEVPAPLRGFDRPRVEKVRPQGNRALKKFADRYLRKIKSALGRLDGVRVASFGSEITFSKERGAPIEVAVVLDEDGTASGDRVASSIEEMARSLGIRDIERF